MNGDGSQGQSQVDLFSQALDLLDEVNKDVEEKVTQVSSEKPANQSTKSIDVVDSAQSQAAVTLPTVSITPRPAATSLLSHTRLPNSGQSLPRVLPITAGLIRSANGKFILTNANGASRGILGQPLANARILQTNITENPSRGMVRNGSAPNLSSTSLLRPTQPLNQPLTSKTVSRIWSTEAVSVKDINTPSVKTPDEEEEAEDDEELGVAETYSDYMPSKVKIGVRHPDSVVETSSLSSVAPPDVWYDLSIPEDIIDGGELSALQLEAIIYSCQRHETILPCGERAGYLIGDGAGVGKGRTVAGVIYENYLCGRKRALWFSVSADLKVDAERDLSDIGASKIPVYALNKFKYSKISSSENGNVKKGVIFSTYSSLIGESQSSGKYRTRMKMLLNWCGADFDGVIVFDECHKAKNLCPTGSSKPTKTGLCVLELQKKLPKARVVYASATGASEPRNMAYMSRLGLWGTGTPFTEFNDFIQAVERRGVGAMELVAMDMKLRGMYIARQLSFQGVSFKIEDIPVPKESIKVYNQAVELWVDARKKFAEAAELIEAERSMKKSMWGQFWSSHQRFFKYLCISSKVQFAIKIAKEALRHRKCVVIGLQSTGEARTLEQLEEMGGELTDFVSTAKGVFQTLIEKHFPAPDTQKTLDIFGLRDKKNSIFDDISLSNILTGNQRKASLKTQLGKTRSGAGSLYKETELSDESPSSSESEFQPSDDESNFSQDEKSSEEEVTSEEDDFNPFNGSDSDDDPWLKKSKNKMGTKRKKTDKPLKAAKKVKSDPQSSSKVKKSSNHKSKQTRNGKEGGDSSSEMSGSEIDELMDSVFNRKSIKSSAHKSQQNDVEVKRELSSNSTLTPEQAKEKASALKKELLAKIEKIGNHLPSNTLDELIDSFGGVDKVAEMTGRKGRVVSDETGAINYELRTAQDVGLEILNLTEKQRFMDGEKLIAIISEAASSGISLQADRRVNNQRRRLHITLELPWSADRAIQQFGRTHRSNQVSAPEYMFLISELAGERRFASTVAKRLECLGALTHGDRRATESRDLSQFNIDNKYGRTALEIVMKSIVGYEKPLVSPPSTYKGNFMEDVKESLVGVGLVNWENPSKMATLEKDYNVISKFLNRILGLPVEQQNALFQYFTETLQAVILQAKRNGKWDMGILDLGAGGEFVKVLGKTVFEQEWGGSVAKTELVTVGVERGLSWEKAMDVWRDHVGSDDGFYISLTQRKQGKAAAILAVAISGGKKREKLYQVYRPNTGLSPKMESLPDLKKKYKRARPDDAEDLWEEQYDESASVCTHIWWKGSCRRVSSGLTCEVGLRTRSYHVLTGSVLSVWNKVEMAIASSPGAHNNKMQVIRLRTDSGQRIVGTLIPSLCVKTLTTVLRQKDNQPGEGALSTVA